MKKQIIEIKLATGGNRVVGFIHRFSDNHPSMEVESIVHFIDNTYDVYYVGREYVERIHNVSSCYYWQ